VVVKLGLGSDESDEEIEELLLKVEKKVWGVKVGAFVNKYPACTSVDGFQVLDEVKL
jgi:hypothetical protein